MRRLISALATGAVAVGLLTAGVGTATAADQFIGQYFPNIRGVVGTDPVSGWNAYRARCFGDPGSVVQAEWQEGASVIAGPSTRTITADGYFDSSIGGVYTLDTIEFVARQQSGGLTSCTLYGLYG